jgi:hypothetical protein
MIMDIKIHSGINHLGDQPFSAKEIAEIKPGEYCQATKNQALKTIIPDNFCAIAIMAENYNFLGNTHINEASSVIEHLDKDNSFDGNEKIVITLRVNDLHSIKSILEQRPEDLESIRGLLGKFGHKNIEFRIGSAIEITKEGEIKEDSTQNILLSDDEKNNILRDIGMNDSVASSDEPMKSCRSLLNNFSEEDRKRKLGNLIKEILDIILNAKNISEEPTLQTTEELSSKQILDEELPGLLNKLDESTAQRLILKFNDTLRKKGGTDQPEIGG